MTTPDSEPVLSVSGLDVDLVHGSQTTRIVDDVSLSVRAGRTLAIVGESGCGKSVTSLALIGLLPPPLRRTRGQIRLDGVDLAMLSEREMVRVRGTRLAMIFQEPRRSLDPAFTIGDQIAEGLRFHEGLGRRAARARAIELLDLVGIANAKHRVRDYPHQFSGGMCQRVMIATALACDPSVLIADEPTTSLDVTVQAQILDLLRDIQQERQLAIVFITHDLGVVADLSDEVVVMYAGQVVERASTHDLFRVRHHPYSEALLRAVPEVEAAAWDEHEDSWGSGGAPPPGMWPAGCRYHPRCPYAAAGQCDDAVIPAFDLPGGRLARCVRIGHIDGIRAGGQAS